MLIAARGIDYNIKRPADQRGFYWNSLTGFFLLKSAKVSALNGVWTKIVRELPLNKYIKFTFWGKHRYCILCQGRVFT